MNRKAILKAIMEKRGNRLKSIDKQFIAIVSDDEYPDKTIMQWLDLKADYKLELIKEEIIDK